VSFLRPQARAALWRWREGLAGAAVSALGAWWILGPGGLLFWVGWLLLPAGAGIALVGIQRARFRAEGQGPGVVRVDEGQVVYFGPLTGGALALASVIRLAYRADARPAHWQLEGEEGQDLMIPVNAEGAEALFDAFATLPGLRTQAMLAAMRRAGAHPVVIWERNPSRPALAPLH